MSEEITKQLEQLKNEKELLDAEKAKLDAEKAKFDAERALATAKQPPDASAQTLKDLATEKAVAEAKKASLEAEKARIEVDKAKLDAEKAKLDAEKALATAKEPPDASVKTLKDLATEKAVAEAKKASLDAEKARIDAAKALATAKQIDPTADAVKDLTAQKSLVDAQKALVDAQQAALISRFIGGDVKAGPYSGSVDVKDKAGTVEASLLAAYAARECAEKIADTVQEKSEGKNVFIFKASDAPGFQKLMNFRFRRDLVQKSFDTAGVRHPASGQPDVMRVAVTAATVAAGLGAVSNLLGFFKTDSTVGGVEVKLDEALVVHTVAGAVRRKLQSGAVHVPSLYSPKPIQDAMDELVAEITTLVELRKLADTEVEKLAAVGADAGKARVEQLNAAIEVHDSFITWLTTANANGITPLTAVASEYAIWSSLEDSTVLLVRLETSGGGYLVKKNLLTGLGAMPLFHMGGAAVSYILFDGASGDVLAGDVVPVYGGYVRSDELRGYLSF
jgi:hypothetical protein